ncbi:RNA/RNP complex-1-interacting phosphatase isoform X2 [Cottoperca gobio]|uniref:RNA/RNP complex-1-interacting phosphatase n=1 Tax=Cottoperca gobio TaxID=56716 RepID=A0A6J2QQB9_COTGO|nr:RNA/RNP complex-1-interacting phosphatase-like isoform X2 [Cottoperca gobio]
MSRKKNGIPDRWLDYKAVGKRLHGTRFIAFKVPLKQALNRQLPCSDVFSLWELLDTLNEEHQELGLIIDLTFTTRYYRLQDVPESLLFVKIFTAGHQVPSDDAILSFKRAVRTFLRDNAENDKLIGVHCTHGLNRTGYLICRYLIDVDGMDPKEAVKLFNSSRGHAVERQNYLEDLQCGPKRSNEGMEEAEQKPMRGLAAHRPSYTQSDSDSREETRPQSVDSRYHRSFPPRGTTHRSHPHHPQDGFLPSPSLLLLPPPTGGALNPYRWTPAHSDSQWRRPLCSEESRSRYPPPEPERRSRYPPPAPESRSRYPPPAPEGRSRYPPPAPEGRSRYAPPAPESRSRYPPPAPEGTSRYPPPAPESRSRYPPPAPESRSRYPPPAPDSRSRYAPPAPESRSRYAPPAPKSRSRYAPPAPESRSRYAPPAPETRSRYAPPAPESRSRYAPPAPERRPSSRLQEDRRRAPHPLPRYSAVWTNESNGHDRPEGD